MNIFLFLWACPSLWSFRHTPIHSILHISCSYFLVWPFVRRLHVFFSITFYHLKRGLQYCLYPTAFILNYHVYEWVFTSPNVFSPLKSFRLFSLFSSNCVSSMFGFWKSLFNLIIFLHSRLSSSVSSGSKIFMNIFIKIINLILPFFLEPRVLTTSY